MKQQELKNPSKEQKEVPISTSLELSTGKEALNSEDVGSAQDGTPEKRENTRSTMAILFVLGFFAILFLCFVYAIVVGASLGELKDALIGIAGALSSTLGFIVGYYYKSVLEQ